MKTVKVETCMESFPHPTIPKQLGEPTRDKISTAHEMSSANASSVESTRGGSQHGLLFITQEPDTYHFLTGHVFMEPTNPGPNPVMVGGVRAPQAEAIKEAHKENLRAYKEHRTASQALM